MVASGVHRAFLRRAEWICVGYLVYISLLSFFLSVPSRRRGWLLAANAAVVAGLCFLPALAGVISQLSLSIFRDWLPAPLILLGYHESGCLTFPRTDQSFEKAFLRWDKDIFQKSFVQFLEGRLPRWVDAVLEFSYLQCYVIVPSGVAVLYLAHLRTCVDHYWSVVLPSVFVAYGLTPLFPAQPPRKLPWNSLPAREPLLLRRFNLWIHDHASIKVNTFPSGHVAGAVAASLAMIQPLPMAAAYYFIIATGIVLGSVRGRYHYSVDAMAGALVAAAAYLCNLLL